MSAIVISELEKSYGAVAAVRGVSLEIAEGEIFGLIGPDGAGKTTTFQVLAGVMEATRGSVTVLGRSPRDARDATGYLTQAFSLYPDLSVIENLRYTGALRKIPSAEIASRGRDYLRRFDMDRFEDRLAGRLSGGMKQKLALACALVARPRILLLDEPTTGVDPVSRREFWDVLANLAADGLTVLVATPYLDEAERCSRMAMMHLGTLRQVGTPTALRARLHAHRFELRTADLEGAERAFTAMRQPSSPILDVQRFGDRLDVLVTNLERGRAVLEETKAAAQLPIRDVRVDEPTLENVFVATLRREGHETAVRSFPARHTRPDVRGEVALSGTALTKEYGGFVAVNGVTLGIRHGEVYGLLGANGAGKTTVIKMLCGLVEPTRGEVAVRGATTHVRSSETRQRIGYMSQRFSLYDDLAVGENLAFFAGVYGVPPAERAEKCDWVLAFAGLEGKTSLLTGSLPGGWKQRVAFGTAIMHEPDILFLDEPTSGVDPLARRALWRMINLLADAGTAILVTTHYLEEAEQCNRLGLMIDGELVAEDSPSGIKERQRGGLLEVVVDKPQQAADVLRADAAERWRVSFFGERLHIVVDGDAETAQRQIAGRLTSQDIRVQRWRRIPFSLEDVFLRLVQERRARGAGEVAA